MSVDIEAIKKAKADEDFVQSLEKHLRAKRDSIKAFNEEWLSRTAKVKREVLANEMLEICKDFLGSAARHDNMSNMEKAYAGVNENRRWIEELEVEEARQHYELAKAILAKMGCDLEGARLEKRGTYFDFGFVEKELPIHRKVEV